MTSEFTFYNETIRETKQVSNFIAELGYGRQKDFCLKFKKNAFDIKEIIDISQVELIRFAKTGKFQDYWHRMSPAQFLKVLDRNGVLQDLGINYFLS
jgi:hypothetical protein